MTGPDPIDAIVRGYGALRTGTGAFWSGREAVSVQGPDAASYLQGQCSQDVEALAVGDSADALILSPQGKVDALVRVTRGGQDHFLVDVDQGYAHVVIARLERFKLRVKVGIESLDWRCLALRGPGARSAPGPGVGRVPDADAGARGAPVVLAVPFAWGTATGVDLLGTDPALPPGAELCCVDAWEALRVEAGIPRMGAEIDERTIAAEAGLVERCVSLTKGCYTGQELVARLDARGNRVARRLCGLVMEAPGPATAAGETVRRLVGAAIFFGDKSVGTVTSAAWSPALDTVAALGYVHRSVATTGVVELRADDADGAARGPFAAEVRDLPLV